MDENSQNEVTHLNDGDRLPAIPIAVPAVDVIKQILEKMLENERRRIRNEFIRLGSFFIILLLMVIAGGFWVASNILGNVKEARLMSEHSQEALMTLLYESGHRAPTRATVAADAESSELQKVIADMESKNMALAALMESQDDNTRSLLLDVLKTRDKEIQKLRARVNSKQAGAIDSTPVDLDALRPQPPNVNITLPDHPPVNSLTAMVAKDLPLRLPIPAP
jgi:hypothetical protein